MRQHNHHKHLSYDKEDPIAIADNPNIMDPKIDRQTTTPFLLKLFYKTASHHSITDFHHANGPQPQHVQIYTWASATLTELSHLIANNLPQLLPSPNVGTRLSFELVYQVPSGRDGDGKYTMKRLGSVVLGSTPKGKNEATNGDQEDDAAGLGEEAITGDESKTLADANFVVGDYVDCAILPPLANGDIAPVIRTASFASTGPRPPPQNGFDGRLNGGGYGGRRGRGGFEDSGRLGGGFGGDSRGGGVPNGEWRRGDVPPSGSAAPVYRGGSGGRGRGRGRGW